MSDKEESVTMHPKYQQFFEERLSHLSRNYQYRYKYLLQRFPPPEDLTKEWAIQFIRQPSQRDGEPLAPDTVVTYLKLIQLVSLWLSDGKEDVTADIPRPKRYRLSREDIPEEDEAAHIMRCAPNEMTRAYLHILTEIGPRADEALSIKIENIKIAKTSIRVIDAMHDSKRISGRMWKVEISRSKTFVRPLWLYHSTPSLHSWLLSHPVKSGPLFVTPEKRSRKNGKLVYKEISYQQMLHYVKLAYIAAGYRDPTEVRRLRQLIRYRELTDSGEDVDLSTMNKTEIILYNQFLRNDYPLVHLESALKEQMVRPKIPRRPLHGIRHLVGTRLEKENISKKKKNKIMGWSEYSSAGDVYSHLVEQDVEDEMFRRAGLLDEISSKVDIESWNCPVCGSLNPSSSSICLKCPPRPDPEENELLEMKKELAAIKAKLDKIDV